MKELRRHAILSSYEHLPRQLAKELKNILDYEVAKDFNCAIENCQRLRSKFSCDAVVNHYLAYLYLKVNNLQEATVCFERALKLESQNAIFYNHAGIVYSAIGDFEKAIRYFRRSLELDIGYGEAAYNLALALAKNECYQEAEQYLYQAIELNHITPILFYNLAYLSQKQNKDDIAILYYSKALEMKADYLECAYNLGEIYVKRNLLQEAKITYKRILKLKPDWIEIHLKLGMIYFHLKDYQQAALHLEPASCLASPIIFIRLGMCYLYLKNPREGLLAYQRGMRQFPMDYELLANAIILCKNYCYWDHLEELIVRAAAHIEQAENIGYALHILIDFSLEQELALAKKLALFYQKKAENGSTLVPFTYCKKSNKVKIRIGYVSSGLRNHPNAHLIKNLFPNHDKKSFEIYLYSTGPRDDSVYATYIPSHADQFIDVYLDDSLTAAKKINQDKIDILVDLTGYLDHSPASILALRPAPIQVRLLGSCSTSGSSYIDYLIADRIVIKEGEEKYYSEKIIFMPHTYFITDRQTVGKKTCRKKQGLPEDKFIFCCFNGTRKYDPVTFKSWMNILNHAPNSVLWLFAPNKTCQLNLLKEAEKYRVSHERIFFATRQPKEQHLARLELADLFLDTFYHSAHTTAIDALWMNLPVLTYYGQNIAQRGAGSILMALDMPEVIVSHFKEYEERAIFYANNKDLINLLKSKIATHKAIKPLFNTELYVKHLESAFQKIWKENCP